MDKLKFESCTKLHELLDIALTELRQAKENGIGIDMYEWVGFKEGKVCNVCLAGAVMNGYGFRSIKGVTDRNLTRRFDALNDLRRNHLASAHNELCFATGRHGVPQSEMEAIAKVEDMRLVDGCHTNPLGKLESLLVQLKKHDL